MIYQLTVYVAGPYTFGDITNNIKQAIKISNQLLDLGVAPFCPHLSHYLDRQKKRPYQEWLDIDLKWVSVCDALFRISGYSPGADREEAYAFDLGKPIFKDLTGVQKWLSN